MTIGRKDILATVLTGLVVLVFAATYQGWNVWLIGGSHRWAAGAILLLGMVTCGLGSPGRGTATTFLAVLGALTFALALVALTTGSLQVLSLLVVAIVLLWAVSTLRHVSSGSDKPVPAA
jgi:hypothetical protein